MRTISHQLLLTLLVLAFVALSCGQSGQPTSKSASQSPTGTLAPTATNWPVPTAPPLPAAPTIAAPSIYLDGWQDIVITHLCLEYSLTGISPVPESLNIETVLLSGLEAAGIQVSTETNDDCDGILTVVATVQPLAASYLSAGTCYSGASVDIRLTLAAQDHQASFHIKNEKSPPSTITACTKNPEDAPFSPLWRRDFAGILGEIWGTPFYFANVHTNGLSSFARDGIKRTAPTAETIDLVLSKLGEPIGNRDDYNLAVELIDYWQLSEAAPYLHAYIHTPELRYRTVIATANCLSSLGELTGTDLPPVIALVEASDYINRELASVFGGVTPPEAAIPPLLAALEDANAPVRGTIAAALANLGEPAYEYVIPMLEDHSQDVRNTIVDNLGYKDYSVIAPLLSFAAETEYGPAKQAVTRILEKVSGDEFEDLNAWQSWWQEIEDQMNSLQPADFATALTSDEVVVRQYTLKQMIELGPAVTDTLPILTEMLRLEREETQLLTALALGALGPEGLDVIINYISTGTSYDIYMIYVALSMMGPDAMDSVPALITNLSKEDIGGSGLLIYPTIVRSLNSITGQSFGGDVEAWQAWWDEQD